MKTDRIIASSGNVFEDIGLEHPKEYKAKAVLAAHIHGYITEKGYTQKQAAEILGIDQPKVSRLVRGLLDEFSTERLLMFLNAFGYDVEIKIKRTPKSRKKGQIRVVA